MSRLAFREFCESLERVLKPEGSFGASDPAVGVWSENGLTEDCAINLHNLANSRRTWIPMSCPLLKAKLIFQPLSYPSGIGKSILQKNCFWFQDHHTRLTSFLTGSLEFFTISLPLWCFRENASCTFKNVTNWLGYISGHIVIYHYQNEKKPTFNIDYIHKKFKYACYNYHK